MSAWGGLSLSVDLNQNGLSCSLVAQFRFREAKARRAANAQHAFTFGGLLMRRLASMNKHLSPTRGHTLSIQHLSKLDGRAQRKRARTVMLLLQGGSLRQFIQALRWLGMQHLRLPKEPPEKRLSAEALTNLLDARVHWDRQHKHQPLNASLRVSAYCKDT